VIDLMTVVSILSFPILAAFLLVEGSAHLFYHRGPNWHAFMNSSVQYAVCYVVVAVIIGGAKNLWKRHKSRPVV
jgi:hypothetical protein